MKYLFVFFILSCCCSFLYSQDIKQEITDLNNSIQSHQISIDTLKLRKEKLSLELLSSNLKKNGLPKIKVGEELIEHSALMLVYSEEHEQAKWVAHIISTEIIDGAVGRTNDFRIDPEVKTGSSEEIDFFLKEEIDGNMVYDGFGYDRGHLAPSADFRWSSIALSESYFYSNMSPQVDVFNRDGWAKLEGMLRGYVYENNVPLYIVTGPVLNEDLDPILRSKNKVSIPKYFFKIAYDLQNEKAICFLMPHQELEYPIESYAISIDSLEQITSIDFSPSLDDDIEGKIEAENDFLHFMPSKRKGDVLPLKILPKNSFNSVDAKQMMDTGKKIKVCGTVVSTHKSKKGNVFLNLDKSFPNQIFSATIWQSNAINFSYNAEIELKGQQVCLTGKVVNFKGTPSMYLDNEKQIKFNTIH